jgi:hypothetical protein
MNQLNVRCFIKLLNYQMIPSIYRPLIDADILGYFIGDLMGYTYNTLWHFLS